MLGEFGGVFLFFVSEGVVVPVPPFLESVCCESDVVEAVFVFVFSYMALVNDLIVQTISVQRAQIFLLTVASFLRLFVDVIQYFLVMGRNNTGNVF